MAQSEILKSIDAETSSASPDTRTIGPVIMEMKHITLRFGGVVAIKDISFGTRQGEDRKMPKVTLGGEVSE